MAVAGSARPSRCGWRPRAPTSPSPTFAIISAPPAWSILRELGRQDTTSRRPFSAEAIPLLRHRLDNEPEAYLLTHVISALGYNCAREALGDVLRFTDHADDGVRCAVAVEIPSLVDPACIEPDAVGALVRLCQDDDAETRWYALYALVNEVVGADPRVLGRAVADRFNDPDDHVRDLAWEHHHLGQHSWLRTARPSSIAALMRAALPVPRWR